MFSSRPRRIDRQPPAEPAKATARAAAPAFVTPPLRATISPRHRPPAPIGEAPSLDALSQFMRELQQRPPLSYDEQLALARQAQNGDDAARARLLETNLRFVVTLAQKMRHQSTLPFEDLIAAGTLGLTVAIRRYQPDRGVPFIGYAHWWIRREMATATQQEGDARLSLPGNRRTDMHRLVAYQRAYFKHTGQHATLSELEVALQLNRTVIHGLLAAAMPMVSLAEPPDRDAPTRLHEPAVPFDDPFDSAGQRRRVLESAFDLVRMPPRERLILRAYFGFAEVVGDECRAETLEEIGARLSVTRQRIQQIRDRAIERLKTSPAARALLRELHER